ncbi:MAG: pentapeptide repeat-containing protein [Verrucomicrobiota bacterium]
MIRTNPPSADPARFAGQRRRTARKIRPAALGIAWLALWIIGRGASGAAPGLDLQIRVQDPQTADISWSDISVVPEPGLQIHPDYEVETSVDLRLWNRVLAVAGRTEPDGARFNQTLVHAGASVAFWRVLPVVDLSGADLIAANLAQGMFDRARLVGADLFAANLKESSLRGANLMGADARFADLTGADLGRAILFGARLFQAEMSDIDLSQADVSYSDLVGANLQGADLSGADLRFATMPGAKLEFAFWRDTKLDEHTLIDDKPKLIWQLVNQGPKGLDLRTADLSLSTFFQVDLSGADMRLADLSGSDVGQANLSGVNLSSAILRFVSFHGSKIDARTTLPTKWRNVWRILNDTNFVRNLPRADLSTAFLVEASLTNANLVSANLNFAVLVRASLRDALLSNADLSSADLTKADLEGANLRGANLTQADLTGANFRAANLTNAILSQAIFRDTIMPDGTVRTNPR